MDQENNPEQINLDGKLVSVQDYVKEHEQLKKENAQMKSKAKKAVRRFQREEELKPFQAELLKLQEYLEDNRRRMIILFEGRDAAGKGGTIRRVTRYMNEKHYRVVALGKPTEEQKTQWYYQKYVSQFPHAGETVLFDRSWYNRAMVERVFDFCTEKEYYDFMRGVVGFERDLVRQDTILVKLYFSVTREEQARRFERRKTDPLRQWKLSEVDVQAQDRWDDFTNVKYEMLKRTHTIDAPWTVVRSNDKHLARLNAIKVILNTVPFKRYDESLDTAVDENIIVSGSRELEIMEVERVRSGKFTD
ncbi:MAG: polyphosphate kinase 2 [Gammaproteobacteria bacterium]